MTGRKRILVLDFDGDLLITLERILENSGFCTTTTWEVGEAVELLQTRSFDFFVVGNRPPQLDARSLIGEVRAGGVKCGAFILGGAQHNQDGFSNLIDQIRAFPRCAHPPQRLEEDRAAVQACQA
jgi:DNA-binding response OmpR family regulator